MMTEFFNLFIGYFKSLINVLKALSFDFMGYSVSLWGIIFAGIIISFVCAVFWRGAKG